MTDSSDASAVRTYLTRASRRLAWLDVARGAAGGIAVAVMIALARSSANVAAEMATGVLLAASGAVVALLSTVRRRHRVAFLIEGRAPQCRNLVVTAAELVREPGTVSPYVRALVWREAARLVRTLDLRRLFPAGRPLLVLAASIALWGGAATLRARAIAAFTSAGAAQAAALEGVDVTVTPPPYSGREAVTLHDPARVEALAGSRLHLSVRAHANAVTVETLGGTHGLAANAKGFEGDVLADADGFIAVAVESAGARAGPRRLIGLSVTPDQLPRVRVTAPARDLFTPDSQRTVDVSLEANDDIGLSTLKLRYTKVSGSGEKFTFTEGEVPVDIVRADGRAWKARGALHLAPLGLTVGDLVVYRGVATDQRPGAPGTESDSYIVEIIGPGAVAAEGFAVDDERDRYAASQQMVILRTERLIARQSSLSADSLTDEAQSIAAEQRAVRAEFVFMMGGEVAEEVLAAAGMGDLDETAEAAAEEDLAAGRLANQGRLALVRAIRSMSHANAALTTADLPQALTDEKNALTYLQNAFARARYILRALTEHERLDLSRRLSGPLSAAARDVRPAVQPAPDPQLAALRHALAGIATLAAMDELGPDAAARATTLAQSIIQADPSAPALQNVAGQLSAAAAEITRARGDSARAALDSAATVLAAAVRTGLARAPRRAPGFDVDRLSGALSDALKHPGGAP